MVKERSYRTLDESEEDYFRKHPEEIDGYLTAAFAAYAEDGCTQALMAQLRVVARVKGISTLAQETGITRNGIQKALSGQGNPQLSNVHAIMRAMGYFLMPHKDPLEHAMQ